MGLHLLRRQWHLQPCCALNGDGLVEGFEWLRKNLKSGKWILLLDIYFFIYSLQNNKNIQLEQ
jgi:hypothetical protein